MLDGENKIEDMKNPVTNESSENFFSGQKDVLQKTYYALASMAWTSWKYWSEGDADDYVQSMIVAKSLIENNGFNHRALVGKYRTRPGYVLKGKELWFAGIHPRHKGQVAKLLKSKDPLYIAKNGVSDGAAMKVIPIAAFFHHDLDRTIQFTDKITQITHNTVEARLAAILVALRFHQILTDKNPTPGLLLDMLDHSISLMDIKRKSRFFRNLVETAVRIAETEADPEKLLIQLATHIGIEHLAWSTPVSACFWSYRADNDFNKWFQMEGKKKIHVKAVSISPQTLEKQARKSYVRHLKEIRQYVDFMRGHWYHWKRSIDIDTFFSISFSLIAAAQGVDPIMNEIREAVRTFGDNLEIMAAQLCRKTDESIKASSGSPDC